MNDRQPGLLGSGEATPWVITGTVALAAAAYTAAAYGAALALLLAGRGWHPAAPDATHVRTLLLHGPAAMYPQGPALALAGALTALAGTATATVCLLVRLQRRHAHPEGLARRKHVRPLTRRAVVKRARFLRPGLPPAASPRTLARLAAARDWAAVRAAPGAARVPDEEAGIALGDLDEPRGPRLFASWEDVILAIMAPRSGKTTAVAAPAVLGAPGPAICTSSRADVLVITRGERERRGRAWVFDPQGIAHTPQEFWWDMISAARTVPGAQRLSAAFVAAAADPAARRDFWYGAAGNVLTSFFHAAARTGGTVTDVLAWLANPMDRSPVNALRSIGMTQLADQLQGTVRGAMETRDGIFETARQVVACLLDPDVARWITPTRHLPRFDPVAFPATTDTVYLMSKNGGGSAAGMIAAGADMLLQAGVAAAERMGGRLDPPMTVVLDEAANVCRLEDLPELYSYLGGTGLPVITILQSYRQGAKAWGEIGMDSLWSAATVKLVGAGMDDADFAGRLSRLVGDYPIWRRSVSFGGSSGHSNSIQAHDRPSMQASEIRTLPKGTALLLATGIPIARMRLRPWYAGPAARRLSQAEQAAKAALRERAEAAYAASLTRYDAQADTHAPGGGA